MFWFMLHLRLHDQQTLLLIMPTSDGIKKWAELLFIISRKCHVFVYCKLGVSYHLKKTIWAPFKQLSTTYVLDAAKLMSSSTA